MEYLEGRPLNYLLTDAVPAEVAIPILLQVCDALQAAHQAGIVHRDLKPENIFLMKRGKAENFVKVLDFGLAKLIDNEMNPGQTAVGLIVGTPEFLSPEQANSAPVDGRSDIYSLGCIAWLLATGRLPFPQRGLADLIVAHRNTNPKAPREVNARVPQLLSDAIMKAMAKDPADRFQQARDFALALDAALKSIGAPAPRPSAPPLSTQTQPMHAMAPPPPPAYAAPPPTAPASPRYSTQFQAAVASIDGSSLGTLDCHDISKGGMFLSTAGPLPPVFKQVKIVIPSAGNLLLLGEVVRHVPVDQARAWGVASGFGVQFIDLTPTLRDAIARLMQGLPVQPMPMPSTPSIDTATVELALKKYRDRLNGDHYVVLGVAGDADLGEIRNRASEALAKLDQLIGMVADQSQKTQLESARTRVKAAFDVLGAAGERARYDANRGNFRGISRCIMGGLGPLDLEKLRAEHLVAHPSAGGAAHVKFLASKAYEARSQWKEALDACENALQFDPLNMQLHQRYVMLMRKARELAQKQ
jgi:serine/threonine-protein kinase